jgi:SAM-dependent methyltransferase
MFGSIYAGHRSALRQSLYGMNDDYHRMTSTPIVEGLQRAYIQLLGIPEIGLRLRALYFGSALRQMHSTPKRVLDAGSGIGAYTVALARRYPRAKVIGCDTDSAKTSFTNSLRDEIGLRNLEFVHGDVTDLNAFGEPFDLIVCIDVLEHVSDYTSALQAFSRMLSPGGILFLHTPQSNQKRVLSRSKRWQHSDHVREGFPPAQLAAELSGLGFKILEARETFGVCGKVAWELNHMALSWNLGFAGLTFPFLYGLARLDRAIPISNGLGIAMTAQAGGHAPAGGAIS